MKNLDLKALFIGDKAENGDFYQEQLSKLVNAHMGWREDYIPSDLPAITEEDRQAPGFVATKEHILDVLDDLSQRMRAGSIPWQSAGRYWGQMNSETLMPALLAYNYAVLWNPNNVALESSMATSQMEAEVGDDFAKLHQIDPACTERSLPGQGRGQDRLAAPQHERGRNIGRCFQTDLRRN